MIWFFVLLFLMAIFIDIFLNWFLNYFRVFHCKVLKRWNDDFSLLDKFEEKKECFLTFSQIVKFDKDKN